MSFKEMMAVADVIAKEHQIDKKYVINALEEGLSVSIKKQFPKGAILKVFYDRDKDKFIANRIYQVVDVVCNPSFEVSSKEHKNQKEYIETFEPVFGRQQMQIAKQILLQRIKNESKEAILEDLWEKSVHLFSGKMKGRRKDFILLEVNGIEISMSKSNLSPKDFFKLEERVYFTIIKDKNGNLIPDRASPKFVQELMKDFVFQIEDGDITINGISRIPGYKTKIALSSVHGNLDPIRICIGQRNNSPIKKIQEMVAGESIELIKYDKNIATYFTNAIGNTNISKILIDEDIKKIQAVVPDEFFNQIPKDLSKLVGELIGWNVDFIEESVWEEQESNDKMSIIQNFISALDIDEDTAEVLYENGFSELNDIIYCNSSEMEEMGFDTETIEELRKRAQEFIITSSTMAKVRKINDLEQIGFKEEEINTLEQNNINNIVDVADLSTYELLDLFPEMPEYRAKSIIIRARDL